MKRKAGQKFSVRLGKGPVFSRGSLVMLQEVVLGKTPALDQAKGRLLIMAAWILVLVWILVGIIRLALPLLVGGMDDQGQAAEGVGNDSAVGSPVVSQSQTRERLRNNLFDVPRAKKAVERKEPKTNPVELIRLIELQGVMGGARPRAMILYKRTKETVTVSTGDDLGEFKVMEIRERSVVLQWRDELFELSL